MVGTALMLIGENSRVVARNVAERIAAVSKSLPPGIQVTPTLDRSVLENATVGTVEKNLIEGVILVAAALFLLLGNVRQRRGAQRAGRDVGHPRAARGGRRTWQGDCRGHLRARTPGYNDRIRARDRLHADGLASGTGAEVQKPLAMVVIGGLIAATVLTLLVLPALAKVILRLGERRSEQRLTTTRNLPTTV